MKQPRSGAALMAGLAKITDVFLFQVAAAGIDSRAHLQPLAVDQPFQYTKGIVEQAVWFSLRLKEDTQQLFALFPLEDRPDLEHEENDGVIVSHDHTIRFLFPIQNRFYPPERSIPLSLVPEYSRPS